MSIQTQLTRLEQAKAALVAKITAKGVTVPADATLDQLADLLESLHDTSAVTATAENVVAPCVFVDSAGNQVTGTLVVQTYYYGADEPNADLGVDGDIYFVMR